VTRYIDAQRATFGVEPICRTLAVAPSSYYAAKVRPPSARSIRDEELKREISRIHAANFGVYGVRKLWRALRREGSAIGRDRVGRLMAALGLTGVSRAKSIRTTQPAPVGGRPADLVERVFAAAARGDRKLGCDHAAAPWYSWIRPPSRSRRRTSRGLTAIGSRASARGGARPRARWGRPRL